MMTQVKIAELVCRNRAQHGGQEHRFTREWSLATLEYAHPRQVAVRCPSCGWAWYVSFRTMAGGLV
jgi:hypothetical protein